MLSCKEVAWAVASEEYAEAGWRRRLAVRFHLFMCRHCHRYAQGIEDVGEQARCLEQTPADEACLKRLEERLLQQVADGDGNPSSPRFPDQRPPT